jgi:hypothetical protein
MNPGIRDYCCQPSGAQRTSPIKDPALDKGYSGVVKVAWEKNPCLPPQLIEQYDTFVFSPVPCLIGCICSARLPGENAPYQAA